MPLLDVRPVYVVQDRATGCFVDINMTFCKMLKHAARADSETIARETMHSAIYEGLCDCPDGFELVRIYELND